MITSEPSCMACNRMVACARLPGGRTLIGHLDAVVDGIADEVQQGVRQPAQHAAVQLGVGAAGVPADLLALAHAPGRAPSAAATSVMVDTATIWTRIARSCRSLSSRDSALNSATDDGSVANRSLSIRPTRRCADADSLTSRVSSSRRSSGTMTTSVPSGRRGAGTRGRICSATGDRVVPMFSRGKPAPIRRRRCLARRWCRSINAAQPVHAGEQAVDHAREWPRR